MKQLLQLLVMPLLALLLISCQPAVGPSASPATAATVSSPSPVLTPTLVPTPTAPAVPREHEVTVIPLNGPLSERRAEISSLAWYGDNLILMPQYPSFSTLGGDSFLYTLPKADILAWLDGNRSEPLSPAPIPLIAPGLLRQIAGYEGFEALAFADDTVYLTIEARGGGSMVGYLIKGEIAPDLSRITLDTAVLTPIPSQSGIANKAEEAMFVAGDSIVTLHEVNGATVNSQPLAHVFAPDLSLARTIPFPNIEYRITDATAMDTEGRFWVINYFYPGDRELRTSQDPLARRYGQGPTHASHEGVERLLALNWHEDGISLADIPPLQLQLLPEELRNWEGLVRL
ncbi:MAG: hypothetical protein GXP38_13485, partial [Chloroflexi bacterium]|nr:hypothetical protein [Chloroflexota bacterium]